VGGGAVRWGRGRLRYRSLIFFLTGMANISCVLSYLATCAQVRQVSRHKNIPCSTLTARGGELHAQQQLGSGRRANRFGKQLGTQQHTMKCKDYTGRRATNIMYTHNAAARGHLPFKPLLSPAATETSRRRGNARRRAMAAPHAHRRGSHLGAAYWLTQRPADQKNDHATTARRRQR
jgi:hypothetical protein